MSAQTCRCGRPTAGAQLCSRCETTFKWSLVNVGVHYVDLETVAQKRTRYAASATKGSIGKTQPLPVDLRFADRPGTIEVERDGKMVEVRIGGGTELRAQVRVTLFGWCRILMEEQPELPGPACLNCLHVSCSAARRRRWPRSGVPSMLAYLARQFRLVLVEPWAFDMFDELIALERQLARMVNRPAERWYAGKCSATDESGNTCTAELYASKDSGQMTCPACGAMHDVADRRGFLLTEAKEYAVTASEASDALMAWTDYDGSEKKLINLIGKWRDAGKLEVQDVTSLKGQDRHLYRLGDIQDLLVEHAQRQQRRRIGA